jgi:hypothetical protein
VRALAVCVLLGSVAHAEPDRLAEATMERRVFRQISVGALNFPARRTTFVLYRGGDQARLDVFCQEGKKSPALGIKLQGEELDESRWLPAAAVRYAGTETAPGTWRLERLGAEEPGCRDAVAELTLTCKTAKVVVRPAGARLIPGKRTAHEDIATPSWKPATRDTLTALRCQRSDGALPREPFEDERWPMVFAPGAGVEWAHENSDMVVQEGSYRRIAPPVVRP